MARKRLSPARAEFLQTPGSEEGGGGAAPIARVAGDAAAQAALAQLSDEMARLRAEGRIILEIPRDQIAPNHLARDRVTLDPEELRALAKSIFDHGQRTPVEVTQLPEGSDKPYGLISGWRRLQALAELRRQTGDPRFDTVLAVVRQPKDSAEAYVSMVEENEIRVGLSYYERARVAVRATELGVFESEKQALLTLFANASRAKRSRIRQFTYICHALDDVLRFPAAIPERLGLRLAELLREAPDIAGPLRQGLKAANPQSAEDELATIEMLIAPPSPEEQRRRVEKAAAAGEEVPRAEHLRTELPNGVVMELRGKVLKIRGEAVTPAFFEALAKLLRKSLER